MSDLELREVAGGLAFPEGPVVLPGGDVLVVEIRAGALARVSRPDGAVYVCNNGGFAWDDVGPLSIPRGYSPETYTGGRIQRVDLDTRTVEDLYTSCDGRGLAAPNDLVFDTAGGFWFTDSGCQRERDRDRGSVYYARCDGSFITEAIFPAETPNGIGLSPDGSRLYVAESLTGRLQWWDVKGPGEVVGVPGLVPGGGTLLANPPGLVFFDSMAVEAGGNLCVATVGEGSIMVLSPEGSIVDRVMTPDPLTTNIAFGGPELTTAYITLGGTGRLVACDWPRPGLRPS
jgi:gluconolactonase